VVLLLFVARYLVRRANRTIAEVHV
jgi:hypothetical protein